MMDSSKILLVEDDEGIGFGLSEALQLEGLAVDWKKNVTDGAQAFQTEKYDLVILDIGLPDGLGTTLCGKIRKKDARTPIIFLTARTDEETLIKALELGANDFVKKPFSQRELFARIRAHLGLNRNTVKEGPIPGMIVDQESRTVSYQQKQLELNRRQFDLLIYFLKHQDQIVTRDQVLEYFGQEGAVFDRTIDSHISQLRKVLKSHSIIKIQIVSIYGIGYRLEIND
jgi:DNA-binding response OmpR family regulator